LLTLLDRFPLGARALSRRTRNREPLQFTDEYDLQYFMHAVLAMSFQDVRPEEWTPSYAGKSSRMDFLLKRDKIVLETKFVRGDHTDGAVADELAIDKARYQGHPDCEVLVCFVYDPERRVRYPEALENDLREQDPLRVEVLVRPK
jgi:hypothetical protein